MTMTPQRILAQTKHIHNRRFSRHPPGLTNPLPCGSTTTLASYCLGILQKGVGAAGELPCRQGDETTTG